MLKIIVGGGATTAAKIQHIPIEEKPTEYRNCRTGTASICLPHTARRLLHLLLGTSGRCAQAP